MTSSVQVSQPKFHVLYHWLVPFPAAMLASSEMVLVPLAT
jgi:hypothetical protein